LEYDRDTGWYRYVALDVIETAILLELEKNSEEPMNISGLCEALDESPHKVRRLMKKLTDEGRVKLMPSVAGPGGSTGHRYRLPSDEADDNHGGLSLG
jgi:predicted ArsR family transcriptional regulator